jgi:hypothetical protein
MNARATFAAALALAGGVAAGVGSFLPWAEISAGPFTEQARGIDGWEGKASLIAGLVMVVAAIRVFAGGRDALARMRPRALLGGLVAAGVGVYAAVTAKDQLLDAAATQLPRAEIEHALSSGLLELSIAVGLYVVIAGGIQGLLAAIVSIGDGGPTPAPSGSGLRGWSADERPTPRSPAVPSAPAPPSPPPRGAPPEPERPA